MYCKECGRPLQKGEEICSYCGTPREKLNIDWNLNNFPEPGKVENLDFNWKTGEFVEQKGKPLEEDGAEQDEFLEPLDKFFEYDNAKDEFQKLLQAQQSRIEEYDAVIKPRLDELQEELKSEEEPATADDEEPEVIWLSQPGYGQAIEHPPEETEEPEEPEKPMEPEKPVEPELQFLFTEKEDSPEEPVNKTGPGTVVLIILVSLLIIAGLFFGVLMGIQQYKPDTDAAKKAQQIQLDVINGMTDAKDKVVSWFTVKKDADSDKNQGEEASDQDSNEGGEPDTDTGTEPDKEPSTPIEPLMHLNHNIQTLRYNDKLALEEGRDYGKKSIKESVPVEDNLEEILGVLIEFNSSWIDYINTGDADVIKLTKPKSQARKNVETFSKVGKVKQEFLLMEIGEVRQAGDEYFVWVNEEISQTDSGKTQVKKYNYVYSLEKVDGEMLITNYYKY